MLLDKYDVARFWSKVDVHVREGGCWEWQAGRFPNGYGQFTINSYPVYAHRYAWVFFHGGEMPEALQVLHRCDNPPCCNPAHLFVGTCADNVHDAMEKGRRAHPRQGERSNFAKLTEADVRDIRARYLKGRDTYDTLAQEYNLTQSAVGFIVKRKTWKHVT